MGVGTMRRFLTPRHSIMFSDLTPSCQERIFKITGISDPEEAGWNLFPIAYSRNGCHSESECDEVALKMLGSSP